MYFFEPRHLWALLKGKQNMAEKKRIVRHMQAEDVPIGFGLTAAHLLEGVKILGIVEELLAEQTERSEIRDSAHAKTQELIDVFERVMQKAAWANLKAKEGEE